MATTREPGWYTEPGDDKIERRWDADGPTSLLRFRDQRQTSVPALRPAVPTSLTSKHPYRTFGPRWWLKELPVVGWLYFPVYVQKREDAERNGELTPPTRSQAITRYVTFFIVCGALWAWYLWFR